MARRRPKESMVMSRSKKGFTLVEILMALSLGGLLLVSAVSLLVSLSSTWANRSQEKQFFETHVHRIGQFLHNVVEESHPDPRLKENTLPIDLQRPVGYSKSDDPLVHFYLREAPPFFYWPGSKEVNGVHAYLLFDESEGLSFLWFTESQELEKNDKGIMEPEEEDELFRSVISKHCVGIEYCYYGEEDAEPGDNMEWDVREELMRSEKDDDKHRLPDFVRLTFQFESEKNEFEQEMTLPIKRLLSNGIQEDTQ